MVTRRAWLVGVIGFCFYLVTIVNNLPSYYYVLTWLIAGILGSSLAIAVLSLVGLHCSWRAPAAIVTENFSENAGGPTVETEFSNNGTLNKTGVQIEIALQRTSDNQRTTRRFLLEALPSGSNIAAALPLRHLQRGRYRVVRVQLIGSDVLGLFLIRRTIGPTKKSDGSISTAGNVADDGIVVGPAALSAGHRAVFHSLATAGGETPAIHRQGQDRDVRGTRFYAPGDDLRHVHWKTTARKGRLVVKEFHHTQQERTLVIWDGALPVSAPEPPRRNLRKRSYQKKAQQQTHIAMQEWSLRLTATLCRTLIDNQRPCALLRLDNAPLALGLGGGPHSYTGNINVSQVSSALADARAARTANLSQAFEPFRSRALNGNICLVTTALAPSPVDFVALSQLNGSNVTVGLIVEKLSAPEHRRKVLALRESGAHVVELELSQEPEQFIGPILAAAEEMLAGTGTTTRRQPVLAEKEAGSL